MKLLRDKLTELMEILKATLIAKQKDKVELIGQTLQEGRGHHASYS